ncbi:MAG: lysophospholipase [Pseudomonadales bacterium]|nr:lysophospholipase [Pseudomonadales bacterium]
METFEFLASDGHKVHCYRWLPGSGVRGVIHLAHGMGEHAGRYDWVAQQLNAAGFAVYADDHRGHGKTADTLGDFGPDGWNRALRDLKELIHTLRTNYPSVPVVLMGHSMGAMLTQQYIELYGDTLDAAVISGSPGFASPFFGWLVTQICRFEAWRLGPLRESALLQNLIFGSANKDFEAGTESPTGFEWLSRDQAEVTKYAEDPLCGFVPFPASLKDIFTGARWTQKVTSVAQIPTNLPLYLFSGTADPVHNQMKDLQRLLDRYRSAGLQVDTAFYEGGRHEMLNETNRNEVTEALISWLQTTLKV